MFKATRPRNPKAPQVRFRFEGRDMSAPAGISLAAALLANGETVFREAAVSGTPRGPYCLMGVCFECLVEVDGKPGHQACQIDVREGMEVRRQRRSAQKT